MKRVITNEELERPLLPYDDAVRLVTASFRPLPPIRLPLDEALGLVCAEDIRSTIDVPGFPSSAMDGYAVRAADTQNPPVALAVAGELTAGGEILAALGPGTAATIMTGGVVPEGADAIVPWEDTDRGTDTVTIHSAASPGKHVRPAGEDVAAGSIVVRAGEVLTAVRLGVIASIGDADVPVHRRPRVAVLSTGDEITAPGGALSAGHVYDANSTLIAALLRSAGADLADVATVRDDPVAISSWLADASRSADLIVTSGGASVGSHDWLREVLERDGDLTMWRVAVKPGKPVALGRIAGAPVIVLPGNPGSAFAAMHCFVIPAVRTMLGGDPAHRAIDARLAEPVRGSANRTNLARVRIDSDRAIPLAAQSSVVLSNLIGADGFAIVPPGGLDEGARVRVELFDL